MVSLLRLSRPGYPTQLIVQDPAHAEVQGRGGAAIGYWSGTTLTVKQKRDNGPRKHLKRSPLSRFGDDRTRKTPENQGVKPTESRRSL